jgi:hypothetical protein
MTGHGPRPPPTLREVLARRSRCLPAPGTSPVRSSCHCVMALAAGSVWCCSTVALACSSTRTCRGWLPGAPSSLRPRASSGGGGGGSARWKRSAAALSALGTRRGVLTAPLPYGWPFILLHYNVMGDIMCSMLVPFEHDEVLPWPVPSASLSGTNTLSSAGAARHRALAIHAALRAGAAGYAFEDDPPQVLVAAIRAVARGHPWPPNRRTADDLGSLTLRERVVSDQLDRIPCLPGWHVGAEPEQRLPKLRL